MAASKKKRFCNGDSNQNSDSDSNEDSAEELPAEEIKIDLEAYNPTPDDFHGIKQLLQQLFLKAHINLSEMTDLIIEQETVTSVLKNGCEDDVYVMSAEDDEDSENYIFGVSSIINLTLKKDKNCVKELKTHLLTKCKDVTSTEDYSKFKSFLEDETKHLGFIINERLINLPGQIAVPVFNSLTEDMKTADIDKPSKKYDFKNYLLISKIYEDKTSAELSTHFINNEEELIMEDAVFKFDFSVNDEKDTGLSGEWDEEDMEFEPKRRIIIFPVEKLESVVNKIKLKFSTE